MKKMNLKAMTLMLAAMLALTGCGDADTAENNAPSDAPVKSYVQEESSEAEYEFADEAMCEEEPAEDGGMMYKRDAQLGMDAEFNTEEYSAIVENNYRSTKAEPLSTFSADVDTASYSNLRRMIMNGFDVPEDAVRIEEMINYFHYDYPQPAAGEPFSVTTEIADCPWNKDTKLMRIGMQAEDVDMSERKPMNLVFLIDVSGSMYDADKLPLVQKSFCMLTEELTARDRISIVTYAGADRVELEGAEGTDKEEICSAIENLEAGGSTAGAAGITTAYEIAERYYIEGGNNRIILATDGDLNVGISSEAGLKSLVEEKRENGVFLSVLGFGMGNIKDNKMETLADNGNGNYSYIDSEREARKVLIEEMGGTLVTVAKDVKFQVEFNPAYIKGYRQIGYENRSLANEDFNDDTKDAGEIGAGHTVTALYEIVMNDSPMEFASSDLKYGDNEASGTENGEYCTVSVRYKEPDGDESKLLAYPVKESAYKQEMSGDMQFASAVAAFGLLLRNSEYKGTADKAMVFSLASGNANDEYKSEFVDLVQASQLRF